MTTMSVSGWMFLLVPAHPGCPGQIPQSRKTVVCVCVASCNYWLRGTLAWEVMQSPHSSVRPSVSSLSFEPTDLWSWSFACVWVTVMACVGLKLKVTGQGQDWLLSTFCIFRLFAFIIRVIVTSECQGQRSRSSSKVTCWVMQSLWPRARAEMVKGQIILRQSSEL